jgi:cytochrome c-type biogenesis protein CcmE
MNPTRRRRLWMVSLILAGAAIATTLTLAALNQNLQHFYSPSDVKAGMAPAQHTFRLGGIVEEGSLKRAPDSLAVEFTVTDRFQSMPVRYEGILPDLFKEGQSVVTTGALQPDGAFAAREVLAKHDENYMPKEVADAIARAKTKKATGGP